MYGEPLFSLFTYWTRQFLMINTCNLSVSIFYSRIFFIHLRRWCISNMCLWISWFDPLLQSLSSLHFQVSPTVPCTLWFLYHDPLSVVPLTILEWPTGLCNQLSAFESVTRKGRDPVWVSYEPKRLYEYIMCTLTTCWLNESSIWFPLFATERSKTFSFKNAGYIQWIVSRC